MQGTKLTMRHKKSRDFFVRCSSSTFLKQSPPKIFFEFIFDPFSLKHLYFSPKLYVIRISIHKYERR